MTPRARNEVAPILTMMTLVLVFVLVASRYARADADLPGGVTCVQIIHYASEFKIPNTVIGRLRAKVIAAALGMHLTDAQLDAAARCLTRKS